MPKTEQVLRIFLASPDDVSDERSRIAEFVEEWNNLWSDEFRVHLKLIRWETHAFPAVGSDGQDVINGQIGEEYDLFVGIMWKRLGTPTSRSASGTVEEFERALARYRKSGSPQLMFYFKKVVPEDQDDVSQFQAIQQFRTNLEKEGLLHWSFLGSEQFGQLARVHLTRQMQDWVRRNYQRQDTSKAIQNELSNRFISYLDKLKMQSTVLYNVTGDFARLLFESSKQTKQRSTQVLGMSDEQLTVEFQMRLLIEIGNEMGHEADAAESFVIRFLPAFSVFVESVLGAANISIIHPAVNVKWLIRTIINVRKKLHPVSNSIGEHIATLEKLSPRLSGVMKSSNERKITALGKFREHVRFGELLLLESERLFNISRRS